MLVTGILLTYNDEKFAFRALSSVLAQDYDRFEILVSDDASSDKTFQILREAIDAYSGPHEVRLVRQERNTGSKSAHLNSVMCETEGEVIVFFDGDDVSDPTRVRKLVEKFSNPIFQAVYSDYRLIDEAGQAIGGGGVAHPPTEVNTKTWFASVSAYASGGTLAIRRAVLGFGALDPRINEDVVLPFRASLMGEVGYIDEVLVCARRHQSTTQNYADFSDLASYRKRHRLGVERADIKRLSRSADIAKAQQLQPDRFDELERLHNVVQRSVADAYTSEDLVHESLPRRLRALVSLRRSVIYRDSFFRDLFLALTPNTYLRYKRFRLRGLR